MAAKGAELVERDSSQEGRERRRERRYDYEGLVRYRRVHTPGMSSEEHSYRRAQVLDISNLGMLIKADEPLEPGQRLEIFAGRDRNSHNISGLVEVVRCTRHRLVEEHYSEYYNPGMFVEYEVALRSPGSKLFDHIREVLGKDPS